MSLIKANGLKASDGDISFPTIPAGQYTCRVTKCEDRMTKADAKNPNCNMWNFTCRVQSEDEETAKCSVFNCVLLPHPDMSPDTYQFCTNNIKHFMLACAVECDGDEVDSSDFIGQEFLGIIIQKTYQGKERNELSDTLPLVD